MANARDGAYAIVYLDVKASRLQRSVRLRHGRSRAARPQRHAGGMKAPRRTIRARHRRQIRAVGSAGRLGRAAGRFDEPGSSLAQRPCELSHRLNAAGRRLHHRAQRRNATHRLQAIIGEFVDAARYARDSIEEASRSTAALYSASMKDRDIAERALVAAAHDALERGSSRPITSRRWKWRRTASWSSSAFAGNHTDAASCRPAVHSCSGAFRPGCRLGLAGVFRLVCARIQERLDMRTPARHRLQLLALAHASSAFLGGEEHRRRIRRAPSATAGAQTDREHRHGRPRTRRTTVRFVKGSGLLSPLTTSAAVSSLGTLQNLQIDVRLDRGFLAEQRRCSRRCKAILDGVVSIADKLAVNVWWKAWKRCDRPCSCAWTIGIIAQGSLHSVPRTSRTSVRRRLRQAERTPATTRLPERNGAAGP